MKSLNNFKLYSEVQLSESLPEFGFQAGDAATLVEIVKNKEGAVGFVLEFFDNEGKTLKVITIDSHFVKSIAPHSVVNYRPYVSA